MTTQEFSNTFDTLLNSYNTQAQFGEQASRREIVLDEYEKSTLLTQAQDFIVKSYFDGSLNQQGQGIDDSTRRQMDFSSLIKVAELEPSNTGTPFDSRGIIYQLPKKNTSIGTNRTDVLFILNEKLEHTIKAVWTRQGFDSVEGEYTDADAQTLIKEETEDGGSMCTSISDAEKAGWVWNKAKVKTYVIVPISYKEYDREMSKPYAQPLKKQAWRLFQNQVTHFDISTELIPKFNVKESTGTSFIYKIRYVRRPQPIILEDLPNDLEIDGESKATECELNPIIHRDIMNKAVELAIATRGGSPASSNQQS
ncbi:MAG: hypothetical protein IJV29_18835 [Butyrivibrio sp.]|nr:hypothetical protein [Butyrivibrio sp.]MBQ7431669.1 hypothetical protein [Butyrivibrio sp.]